MRISLTFCCDDMCSSFAPFAPKTFSSDAPAWRQLAVSKVWRLLVGDIEDQVQYSRGATTCYAH